jgi:ribosomal protein S18 acetylase RimI-like enzyme
VDLCFQNFTHELEHLREVYGPPRGALLLAWHAGEVVGCVALRPVTGEVCEMKRLYVRESARRLGLGRRLAEAITEQARSAGYTEMVLDTLASLLPAIALYRSLGFVETAPYYANPLPGVVYLKRELRAPPPR